MSIMAIYATIGTRFVRKKSLFFLGLATLLLRCEVSMVSMRCIRWWTFYLNYLEIAGSIYLSPYSISWGWGDWLCFAKNTIDLVEEVSIVAEVEEAWGVGLLVPTGLEC